ncbi:Cationic amino acid transporter 2, vacuolar [Vitis vinifera]|uniref:Cationic amino acid transporter 2, vacuolar n=2 Tax=Vitis vinifera TaxID=29760 RepID=A0A438FXJ6_VITVI|nr:Cationic amino acid transporter 2, vacuolar [Vitis vinifera]
MNGGRVQVEAIHVDSCSFKETQNRARIKTWQGGSGHARNITFNSIKFYDTENPIIIDQYYRPQNRLIRLEENPSWAERAVMELEEEKVERRKRRFELSRGGACLFGPVLALLLFSFVHSPVSDHESPIADMDARIGKETGSEFSSYGSKSERVGRKSVETHVGWTVEEKNEKPASPGPPPIRVSITEMAGRGVFATRRMGSGDLIHTAKLLITHPSLSSIHSVCYFCLRKLKPWLHLHEHIDLGIQYDPSTGIYGMNLFVVLERLGYRAGLRFICPFVPLLPIACILINVYLLVNLGSATWTRVSIWLVMGTLVYGFYGRRHSSLQDAIYVPAADVDEIYGSFSHCSDGLGVVILAVCISNSEFASCSGWWSLPECRISDHPWHEDTAFSCTATKLNTVAPLGTHS